MAELRRRKGTWAYCDGECSRCNTTATTQTSMVYLIQPNADAVERKVGKWLESNESISRPYMCSNCGCLYDVDTIMGKLCWKYCPNCGAEMEEDDA